MRTYPVPFNELGRLDALKTVRRARDHTSPALEKIVSLATQLMEVPTAMVSLVDEQTRWYKARKGPVAYEIPRNASICPHTIMSDAPLVVPDLLEDSRFRSHPSVVHPPHLRFYCGVPIILSSGFRVGSLCTIDPVPHDPPSEEAVAVLESLARSVVRTLEAPQPVEGDSRPPSHPAHRTRQDASAKLTGADESVALIHRELTAPLDDILRLAAELGESPTGDATRETAAGIRRAGAHLETLVARVLGHSDTRTGELYLKEEWTPCDRLVDQAAALVEPRLTAAGVEFTHAERADETQVHVDPAHFTAALSAVIYHVLARGSAHIAVDWSRTHDAGIAFAVLGTVASASAPGEGGWGIAPSPPSAPPNAGEETDHDLSLARRLTDLHGGELAVWVEQGSIQVTLQLPYLRSAVP